MSLRRFHFLPVRNGTMSDDGDDNTSGQPPAKAHRSPLVPPNDNFSEDELVVKSFIDLVQQKIDDKILGAPSGREGQNLREAVLYPGFYIGAAVGIAQFAMLRKAPIMVRLRRRSCLLPM
jgi:hypothetical protein